MAHLMLIQISEFVSRRGYSPRITAIRQRKPRLPIVPLSDSSSIFSRWYCSCGDICFDPLTTHVAYRLGLRLVCGFSGAYRLYAVFFQGGADDITQDDFVMR